MEDLARQPDGPRGPMEEPYDGVEELWWRSRGELTSAMNTAKGRMAVQELLEDEAKFIDFPNSQLWFAYEYPQVNPSPENIVATEMSPLVKLYYPMRHLASMREDEPQLYWHTSHGPLSRSIAATSPAKRYIQVHRYKDELEDVLREARGTVAEPYFGHAELWLDSASSSPTAATPEGIRARQLLLEDEARFIDFTRSTMFRAKELAFVDYR